MNVVRDVAGNPTTGRNRFYLHAAWTCAAVAFIGFAPTYWMPMAQARLSKPFVVHLHRALFFSWTLFFVYQTWLAANGRVARHREVGLLGVSLATAMVFAGCLVAYLGGREVMAAGGALTIQVPLGDLLCFVVLVTVAMCNTRRTETHKRALLLATVSILGAAVARWYGVLAPGASLRGPLYAALTADLVVLLPLIHDWRTRRGIHAVYASGIPFVLQVQVGREFLTPLPAWQAFMRVYLTAPR